MTNLGGCPNPGSDLFFNESKSVCHSVASDSVRPHGLWPPRLLCPLDSPGKNTGVGCHFLLQGIFRTQGWNSCHVPWQAPMKGLGNITRGSEGFGKLSGDETSHEEAPRAELTVCSPLVCSPLALTSVLSGNHLLQILQEGFKPLVGAVGSRTRASSLCPVPLPFIELMPVKLLVSPANQSFGDIPWKLKGELIPSPIRDPAQPYSTGRNALNITQRVPCRWGRHILPQVRALQVFPFG